MRSSDGCSEDEEGLFDVISDMVMSSELMVSRGQILSHQVSFQYCFKLRL